MNSNMRLILLDNARNRLQVAIEEKYYEDSRFDAALQKIIDANSSLVWAEHAASKYDDPCVHLRRYDSSIRPPTRSMETT